MHSLHKPIITALVLGVTLPSSWAFAQSAPLPHTPTQTAQMVMIAQEAMQKDDCAKANPALDYLWDDKSLSDSDRDLANDMRINRILCAGYSGDDAQALALSEKNIARSDSNISAFIVHTIILDSLDKHDQALATLIAGVKAHPDEVSKISESFLFKLTVPYHGTPETVLPLLIALENAQFSPKNGFVSGYFASIHLKALRKTQDPALIKLHRSAITRAPDYYMIMMGDGALSQPDEPLIDVAAALQTEAETSVNYLIDNSTDLTALMAIVSNMRQLGQNERIVQLTEVMIPAIEKDGIDNFQNDYFYSMLLSARALALADLGRHDESVAAFEDGYAKLAGRDLGAYMGDYLNFLTDMGDEVRALALLETFDLGSLAEDDAKTIAQVEACAAFYASDKPRSDKALARLPENDMARMKPYLCRGEDEKAATLLKTVMTLPEARDEVIAYMQNTLTPIAWSARDQDYVDHLLTIKHRPDVLQEAAKNKINIRSWPVR